LEDVLHVVIAVKKNRESIFFMNFGDGGQLCMFSTNTPCAWRTNMPCSIGKLGGKEPSIPLLSYFLHVPTH
jgi:hypothetical protein